MLGLIIRDARKAKGLNQEDVAKEMGISVSQLSRFEQGKKDIDTESLTRGLQFLNIPITLPLDAQHVRKIALPADATEEDEAFLQEVAKMLRDLQGDAKEQALAVLNVLRTKPAKERKS